MPRRVALVAVLALALVALAAVAGLAGCRKKVPVAKGPSPELTGLAAVPSTAENVIGMDAGRLAGSPLVTRAIEMVLSREPDLATRWQALRESCKLELDHVKRVMLAIGPPPPGGRIGTGPMVLIATGKIAEAELVTCVRQIVGKGGGSIVVRNLGTRTLYQVTEGARTMFIAFGRPDTVILGNNEAYVQESVGDGKKALDNPELAEWLQKADQDAPVWVVGRVSDRLRTGLVRASDSTLKAGPRAFLGTLDLTSGFAAELVALMESPEDAKQLESLANINLVGFSWAAQNARLAKVVQKIKSRVDGATLRLSAPLTMDDVNRVLSALDGDQSPEQDSPPAGSAATPPAPQ